HGIPLHNRHTLFSFCRGSGISILRGSSDLESRFWSARRRFPFAFERLKPPERSAKLVLLKTHDCARPLRFWLRRWTRYVTAMSLFYWRATLIAPGRKSPWRIVRLDESFNSTCVTLDAPPSWAGSEPSAPPVTRIRMKPDSPIADAT